MICGEAFHWIAPDAQWTKTAAVLKNDGYLALFWSGHHRGRSRFAQALEQLFREKRQNWSPGERSHQNNWRRRLLRISRALADTRMWW